MMKFDINKLEWTRKPNNFSISEEKIEIVKNPPFLVDFCICLHYAILIKYGKI